MNVRMIAFSMFVGELPGVGSPGATPASISTQIRQSDRMLKKHGVAVEHWMGGSMERGGKRRMHSTPVCRASGTPFQETVMRRVH